jgi:ATP-binding protein involved in chromosome partitioning
LSNATQDQASLGHGGAAGLQADPTAVRLKDHLARIHHKVIVLSGKGGVGKSTVAVNLAVALAQRGLQVGLLDIDLHGPSVPKMLHLEGARIPSDGASILPVEFTLNLKVMSIGFFLPSDGEAVIWRGPRKYTMIKQFLADVAWGDLDFLVVDAPPGTGDEPLAVVELLGTVDGAVVVTTPQQLSITDVRKSVAFCRELHCPVLGIIENMSGLVCPHCGQPIEVFAGGGGAALAREAGVPFLGAIPIDPTVARSGDTGEPFLTTAEGSPAADALRNALRPLLAMDGSAAGPVSEPGEAPR